MLVVKLYYCLLEDIEESEVGVVCNKEDDAHVNGQVKGFSLFFERAKFAASGWLIGSPGSAVKAENKVYARDKGADMVSRYVEHSSSCNWIRNLEKTKWKWSCRCLLRADLARKSWKGSAVVAACFNDGTCAFLSPPLSPQ